MSCEECDSAEEKDGAIRDCETEKGCLLPPLDPDGRRVLALRNKLITLKDLVDPGTVLRTYGATRDDLDLLVAVEAEMDKLREEDKPEKQK